VDRGLMHRSVPRARSRATRLRMPLLSLRRPPPTMFMLLRAFREWVSNSSRRSFILCSATSSSSTPRLRPRLPGRWRAAAVDRVLPRLGRVFTDGPCRMDRCKATAGMGSGFTGYIANSVAKGKGIRRSGWMAHFSGVISGCAVRLCCHSLRPCMIQKVNV
jgi:hypothetical protein